MEAKRFVEIHKDKGNLEIKEDLNRNSAGQDGFIVTFDYKLEDEIEQSAKLNKVSMVFLSLDGKGITTARIYDETIS